MSGGLNRAVSERERKERSSPESCTSECIFLVRVKSTGRPMDGDESKAAAQMMVATMLNCGRELERRAVALFGKSVRDIASREKVKRLAEVDTSAFRWASVYGLGSASMGGSISYDESKLALTFPSDSIRLVHDIICVLAPRVLVWDKKNGRLSLAQY